MRYNFKRRNGNYMSKKAKQYSATEKMKIVGSLRVCVEFTFLPRLN